jgi:hypothetical protein
MVIGSISFVLVYACFSASSNLFRHGTETLGLFGKTFGAYLYRFSDNLWRT